MINYNEVIFEYKFNVKGHFFIDLRYIHEGRDKPRKVERTRNVNEIFGMHRATQRVAPALDTGQTTHEIWCTTKRQGRVCHENSGLVIRALKTGNKNGKILYNECQNAPVAPIYLFVQLENAQAHRTSYCKKNFLT